MATLAGCSSDGPGTTQTGTARTATTRQTTQSTTAATASATATPTDTPTGTPTETATQTETQTATETTTRIEQLEQEIADVSFEGEYFDTHAHWLQNDLPSSYAPVMASQDIGATVVFSPTRQAATDYEGFLETLTEPDVDYLPFMSAPPPRRRLNTATFRSVYEGHEPAFFGIGEWKPQQENAPGLTEPPYSSLFQAGAALDLPVMFHPFSSQEGSIEPALSRYSETTFLLHGYQMLAMGGGSPGNLGNLLPRLLAEYDNLYWQADVATMLGGSPFQYDTASAWIDWYESSRADEMIANQQSTLTTLLDTAPDRIMWGTDVARSWHFDDRVLSRFVEATERILDGVPERHHAAYKHENALAFFGL